MHQKELKQLFERLILVAAAPASLSASLASCSGRVQENLGVGGGGPETAGGRNSSTTVTKGLGGFLGTIVMVGGSATTGGVSGPGTSLTKGLGGFLGIFPPVGGTSSTSTAAERVTCPDATTNDAGDTGQIRCAPPFCVKADVTGVDAASLDRTVCAPFCGNAVLSCSATDAATPGLLKCYPDCTGRRPAGLAHVETFCENDVGQYFSEVAHLEAASVAAFRALGRQLKRFGAPQSLRNAARQATRDEVRHTRLGSSLAERFGGRYRAPVVHLQGDVTLEAMARENAIEGCVRETYGALVASYQARNARDPAVRAAMRQIARDETRHAATAWAVARWVDSKLDVSARQRVREARQAEVGALMNELGYRVPESLQYIAGVPAADVARGMARALAKELWV